MVGAAANVWITNDKIVSASVGITGVGEHTYRATTVENALRGKPASAIAAASDRATEGVSALSDNFASADYRQHLARVFTRRALEEAAARAG